MNFEPTVSATLGAVGESVDVRVEGSASALIQVMSVASASGIQLEALGRLSDAAPWVLLHLMPTPDLTPGSPISKTAAISTLPTLGWRVDTQGMSTLRVRISDRTAGGLVVAVKPSVHAYS